MSLTVDPFSPTHPPLGPQDQYVNYDRTLLEGRSALGDLLHLAVVRLIFLLKHHFFTVCLICSRKMAAQSSRAPSVSSQCEVSCESSYRGCLLCVSICGDSESVAWSPLPGPAPGRSHHPAWTCPWILRPKEPTLCDFYSLGHEASL